MTRILLVDDHPIVRAGLRAVLATQAEVSEAATTPEALAALAVEVPDLVVTDLVMEGPDGIHLTKAIKASWPDLPVLILSSYEESWFAERALLAGASGYVMKDGAVRTLCHAVDVVLAGGIWLSEAMRPRLAPDDQPLDVALLDDDERALVAALGQRNPSATGLARTLGTSVERVDAMTLSVMRKLGLTARVELIVRASDRPGQGPPP